jgi:hypothetical protein
MIFSIKAPCHKWYINGYLKIGHPIIRHSALRSRAAGRFTLWTAFMLFPENYGNLIAVPKPARRKRTTRLVGWS